MNLQIQTRDFTLTDGLRQHVATRLAYALNHGRDLIRRIVVRLSDINGPRGGEDKCCGIEVRLKGAPALVVEDVQADLYLAIDRASERIGRTLDRHLARRRENPVVSATRKQSAPIEMESRDEKLSGSTAKNPWHVSSYWRCWPTVALIRSNSICWSAPKSSPEWGLITIA